VGLSSVGVTGPDEVDGVAPGTVVVGLAVGGDEVVTAELRLPGDRERLRSFATISAFDLLRKHLSSRAG
jgi:nicotinamide-nucleotide amidase